ncbi:MAG: hypothetical protein KDJ99_29045, partial [Candidatus Competibacteraceae bacterium]|nr:hypothetical protein [Candidatus Competibacteraceae bacterium]
SQVRKALLERGISAEIYTLNHKLANEQLQAFQVDNAQVASASWQGRQQCNEQGEPLCQRADAVRALESVDVHRVARLLCGIRLDGKPYDPDDVCPHARQCLVSGYLRNVQKFSRAMIKITQHALLTQPREQGQQPADIAVIDENPLTSLIQRAAWDATTILQHDGILSAAAAAIVAHKECWLAKFRESHPQALAEVKQWLATHAPKAPAIQPGMPDSLIQATATVFAECNHPHGVWRFAKLLAEALASDSERYNGLYHEGGKIRAAWIAHPDRLADMPVLILDGTAEPDLLRRMWPELDVVDISVKRNAHVVQIWDTACSHSKLGDNPRKLRERIQHFIESLPGRGAVIGPKSFVEQVNVSNADRAHFGHLRGLDFLKAAEWGVIVGRIQPPVHDVEAIARALAPYDCLALGGDYQYTPSAYRGQGGLGVAVHMHADPLVNSVLRQLREAETEQAIDRLRLVHNTTPKTVYLLSSLPVDIHVNELTKLVDLLPDYRLAEALSRYPVLPLGRAWLAEHLPDVFKTPKSAERWLSRMPQNAIRRYIEFWGICHGTYRVQGIAGKAMRFISKTADRAVLAAELARLHGTAVTVLDVEHQITASAPEITPAPEAAEAPLMAVDAAPAQTR